MSVKASEPKTSRPAGVVDAHGRVLSSPLSDCDKCKGKNCVASDKVAQLEKVTVKGKVREFIKRDPKTKEPILKTRKRCTKCGVKN